MFIDYASLWLRRWYSILICNRSIFHGIPGSTRVLGFIQQWGLIAWNLWVLVSSLSLPVLVRSLSSFLGHRHNSAIVQGSSYESKPSLVSTLLWHAPLRADPRKTNDPTSSRNLPCKLWRYNWPQNLKLCCCSSIALRNSYLGWPSSVPIVQYWKSRLEGS